MTVRWNGAATIARVRTAAMRGVIRGTESVHEEAVLLQRSSPRSGKIYRRRGVEHKASGPGEPPAPDTGRLIGSGRTDYQPARLYGKVTFSTAYARGLELGTERVEPRPFLRPALARKVDDIERDVAKEIKDALR